MESTRADPASDRAVTRSLSAVARAPDEELDRLDRNLAAAVEASPAWREKDELLRSIPGVGPVVRRTLPADRPGLGTLTREQVGALVGVAPVNRDDGRHTGGGRFAAGGAGHGGDVGADAQPGPEGVRRPAGEGRERGPSRHRGGRPEAGRDRQCRPPKEVPWQPQVA